MFNIVVKGTVKELVAEANKLSWDAAKECKRQFMHDRLYYERKKDRIAPDYDRLFKHYAPMVASVVAALRQSLPATHTPRMFVARTLAFVQCLPYERAEGGFRRPFAVLTDLRGNCGSKTTLFLALLHHAYPTLDKCVCLIPQHVFAGVKLEKVEGDIMVGDENQFVAVEPVGIRQNVTMTDLQHSNIPPQHPTTHPSPPKSNAIKSSTMPSPPNLFKEALHQQMPRQPRPRRGKPPPYNQPTADNVSLGEQMQHQYYEERVVVLVQRCTEAETKLGVLTSERRDVDTQLQHLQMEIEFKRSTVAEAEALTQQLHAERRNRQALAHRRDFRDRDMACRELTHRCQRMTNDLVVATTRYEKSEAALEHLTGATEARKEDLRQLQADVQRLQAQLADARAAVESKDVALVAAKR
ncbi:hypothetical protein DYB34_000856 [Aphanomyces astaci]|uniref:Uncharacterized protein n=1 Tax=Aphanomyces astaci TaxID=112090 RepID=A0A3R7DJN5_APHAT|nr:hypothetical protein DYB34_000856 [Aphanomyces astaci]